MAPVLGIALKGASNLDTGKFIRGFHPAVEHLNFLGTGVDLRRNLIEGKAAASVVSTGDPPAGSTAAGTMCRNANNDRGGQYGLDLHVPELIEQTWIVFFLQTALQAATGSASIEVMSTFQGNSIERAAAGQTGRASSGARLTLNNDSQIRFGITGDDGTTLETATAFAANNYTPNQITGAVATTFADGTARLRNLITGLAWTAKLTKPRSRSDRPVQAGLIRSIATPAVNSIKGEVLIFVPTVITGALSDADALTIANKEAAILSSVRGLTILPLK